MNTFTVTGTRRQVNTIGILESFSIGIKTTSRESAVEGARFYSYQNGFEMVHIESVEFGNYDNFKVYLDFESMHDVSDLKQQVTESGSYYFSPDTMRFFKSRVAPDFHKNGNEVLFITSEQNSYGNNPRLYSIRIMTRESYVSDLGEFQEYQNLYQARKAIKNYLNG